MDNFFCSLPQARRLLERNLTLPGTIKPNKREIPKELRHHQGKPLHSSQFVFAEEDNIQLVSYKAKPNKMVLVLSSLHAQISVQEAAPFKHTAILDYNMIKGGVDVMDHMKSEYAVKYKSLG